MNITRCLVVIDMQEGFGVINGCDITNMVVKRICEARRNSDHIILLEVFGGGNTISDISDCLPSYVNPLVKHENSGHAKILEYLDEQGLSFDVYAVQFYNMKICFE